LDDGKPIKILHVHSMYVCRQVFGHINKVFNEKYKTSFFIYKVIIT